MSPPTVASRAVSVPPVKLGTLLKSAIGKYAVPGRSSTNSFQRSPYSALAWLASVLAVCEPCHCVPSSNSTGLVSTPLVPMDQNPVGVLNEVGAAPSRSSVKSSTMAPAPCAPAGAGAAHSTSIATPSRTAMLRLADRLAPTRPLASLAPGRMSERGRFMAGSSAELSGSILR